LRNPGFDFAIDRSRISLTLNPGYVLQANDFLF